MKTSNMIYLGLGIGVLAGTVLLFTTDRGKKIRGSVADGANLWTKKLTGFARSAGDELTKLKNLVENEATELTDDARERILNILNEGAQSAKKVKKNYANNLANSVE